MNSNDDLIYAEVAAGLFLMEDYGFLKVSDPNPDTGSIGTIAAWIRGLQGLTPQQIRAGFDWLAANWTTEYGRKPAPGEIRKALAEAGNKAWSEAFDEIQRKAHFMVSHSLKSSGRNEPAQWSCPEIAEAVAQMGGVSVFLNMQERDLNTTRAQFRDVWTNVQKRQASRQLKALPQPPQAPQLSAEAHLSLNAAPAGTIDFSAEVKARKAAAYAAEQKRQMEAVRARIDEIEARKSAEKRAKVEAKMQEQKSLIRASAEALGYELQTFELPEVLEG